MNDDATRSHPFDLLRRRRKRSAYLVQPEPPCGSSDPSPRRSPPPPCSSGAKKTRGPGTKEGGGPGRSGKERASVERRGDSPTRVLGKFPTVLGKSTPSPPGPGAGLPPASPPRGAPLIASTWTPPSGAKIPPLPPVVFVFSPPPPPPPFGHSSAWEVAKIPPCTPLSLSRRGPTSRDEDVNEGERGLCCASLLWSISGVRLAHTQPRGERHNLTMAHEAARSSA